MIKITLPDNSVREYEKGIKALDLAKSISEGLARSVLYIMAKQSDFKMH